MSNSPKLADGTDLNKPLFSYTLPELIPAVALLLSAYFPATNPKPEQGTNLPEVLDKDEARQYLGGISLSSLNTLIREKKIIPVRPTPDRICFLREDLRNYLLQTKKAA